MFEAPFLLGFSLFKPFTRPFPHVPGVPSRPPMPWMALLIAGLRLWGVAQPPRPGAEQRVQTAAQGPDVAFGLRRPPVTVHVETERNEMTKKTMKVTCD